MQRWQAIARLRHPPSYAGRRTVEYVGAILVPEDEAVFHVFAADSSATVREACPTHLGGVRAARGIRRDRPAEADADAAPVAITA